MKTVLIIYLLVCCGIVQAQLHPFFSSANNKYGFIDSNRKVSVSPKYDFAWDFTEGMSSVKIDGKYGYVNEIGIELIPPIFDGARAFSDGLAVVKVGHKFGFVDKKGKLVIPAIYDRADNFHGDRANVCLNKKWSILIYPVKTTK